jgi:hypothetical protein
VDTLTGNDITSTWAINAANAGSLTDANGANAFTGVENLTGGTGNDSFTLSVTGNISGTITGGGGAGVDTLTGNNLVNAWAINGANAGSLTDTNGANAFTGIENLTGNANNDAFTFGASGSISGLIDGAGQATADTADYSTVTGAVSVTLGTGIVNVETVTGSGDDTLVGANITNTWAINAANAGSVNDGDGGVVQRL